MNRNNASNNLARPLSKQEMAIAKKLFHQKNMTRSTSNQQALIPTIFNEPQNIRTGPKNCYE